MLNFLGIGSAFNTELGNNSAYIKEEENIFLIDCGGTIFDRILKANILDDTKNVYVFITHTHPDHIGSLGDLILYVHYKLKGNITVIHPDTSKIQNILGLLGVNQTYYKLIEDRSLMVPSFKSLKINVLDSSHSSSLDAFSLVIENSGVKIYYSGDSNSISESILEKFENREIKFIYQDTCCRDYVGSGHLYVGKLSKLINSELREFVYCMHLENDESIAKIKSLGFNIASIK